jgi:hypothetical protein
MMWSEARRWLAANNPLLAERSHWMLFGWPQERPTQTLQVQRLQWPGGGERIVLGADVLPAAAVASSAVLAASRQLVDGALVVLGELLVLRVALPLDEVSAARLQATVISLRDDAMRLRASLRARRPAELFNEFAD